MHTCHTAMLAFLIQGVWSGGYCEKVPDQRRKLGSHRPLAKQAAFKGLFLIHEQVVVAESCLEGLGKCLNMLLIHVQRGSARLHAWRDAKHRFKRRMILKELWNPIHQPVVRGNKHQIILICAKVIDTKKEIL